MINLQALSDALIPLVLEAGDAIMSVYQRVQSVTEKQDGSPVTEADKKAERLILRGLSSLEPDITVISEENAESHKLQAPELFFLVDPLDGTKEFLKEDGKGAFTVNIALIRNACPILGVVYAPALNRLFVGYEGGGSFENGHRIRVADWPEAERVVAVASASHRDAQTDDWLRQNSVRKTVSIGSSLKFGLVAAGEANIYPRFGPTMEWDTAAGDAVLRAAGGRVENPDGSSFCYGKSDYKNGPFIAMGK